MIACSILAIVLEFHLDSGIWHPSFLNGHRDFIMNILLGALASAAISFVMVRVQYKNKKADLQNEIYPHFKKVRKSFEEYYKSILDKNYDSLIKNAEVFEEDITKLLNCYYSYGVTLCEYKRLEKIYCPKIIQYSTHIINFNIVIHNKTDKKVKKLFDNVKNGISKLVYDEFVHVLDEWINKYEKRFIKQPSQKEVYKSICKMVDEYDESE